MRKARAALRALSWRTGVIVGGGVLGVVDESNWTVCTQEPPAGDTIEDAPRLVVDRDCPAAESDTEEPTEASETAADEKGRWIDALALSPDGSALAWSAGKTVKVRDRSGAVKTMTAPSSVRGSPSSRAVGCRPRGSRS